VIALTTTSAIKKLSEIYKSNEHGTLDWSNLPPPMENLFEIAGRALKKIIVSRRLLHKLSGKMHDDNPYGSNSDNAYTVRTKVEDLSPKDLKKDYQKTKTGIADSQTKKQVQAKLASSNSTDPKKAFADPKDHPSNPTKDQCQAPIHKVTLAKNKKLVQIGKGHRKKLVKPNNNHHMAIYKTTDAKGKTKYLYEVVTLLEAMRRHAADEPIINKKEGFIMALRHGDTVAYDINGETIHVWVRTVTASGTIGISPHTDARLKKEQINTKSFQSMSVTEFCELNPRRTSIDALGKVKTYKD
jgi:hypothetical protein